MAMLKKKLTQDSGNSKNGFNSCLEYSKQLLFHFNIIFIISLQKNKIHKKNKNIYYDK